MMRILVSGAAGQLGGELRRVLQSGTADIGSIPRELTGAEVVYTDAADLDIIDAEMVDAFVRSGMFELVINCAAMTNVDGCEANEELAFAVNAQGAENMAKAAASVGCPIVQVSTDYVFSGEQEGERVETDPTGPISVYGRSKLEGERRVMAANPRHHIIRTAWLYGRDGGNFAKTMLRLAKTHDEVTVVCDQWGNPTNANDLVYEVLKIAATEDYGLWHCTNEGTCSWADFAEAVLVGTGCQVRRCTSQEYKAAHPESADRPRYSALKNKRLEQTIGNEMRSWQEALQSCRQFLSMEEK